ncbi:hypothetical protein [Winogradskyella bathintestinalis]|uniref:Tetratricopeptide repeat protein n=1 Tax=Winogradskyella bathintestinalis TaxID=3035208 RepID=A0ABT7ZX95_9FLAO|nr:hypothetical protein [Winogradskyella bathintestinalis]MDN3493618.1 hypothetical protein [Winogradskyella bathintestinalis]
MKHYLVIFFISIIVTRLCAQNNAHTSEGAFTQFMRLSDSISASFPEDDIKTFRRASFSESQLQTYLSLHFQRLDLLKSFKGHHSFILDSYLHSGNWFREVGFPKESINSYRDFFNYYQKNESRLAPAEIKGYIEMQTYARSMLAESYAKLGILDSAAKEHKENIKFTKNRGYIYYPSAINNYGLFLYWHKKELDSALYVFNKAYAIVQEQFSKHTLIGSIRDNIADIKFDQQNYSEAHFLYSANFEFFKIAVNEISLVKDIPRLISAGTQLVTTNINLNDLEEAQRVFNDLEKIVHFQSQINDLETGSKLEFLNVKESLYKKLDRIEEAYHTSEEIRHLSDSLQQIANNIDKKWQEELNDVTIDRIALNFKLERIQKENKIRSQRNKLWFSGLLSSIFIILLVALIINRRQHLINAKNKQLLAEQRLENSALKVEQLNSEIKSKERDLSDFAIKLTQDQDWAMELADKLEAIKQASPKDRESLLQELDLAIANKVNVDSDTQDFFNRLDKLSDAFYSKLTNSYPNLSKNEIRLCSLIRLKIESRSIATLQNITLASLNTSRYRLRKKLNLSEDIDLDFFIYNM